MVASPTSKLAITALIPCFDMCFRGHLEQLQKWTDYSRQLTDRLLQCVHC